MSEESTNPQAEPESGLVVACPACGEALEIAGAAEGQLVQCPSCGEEFGIAGESEEGAEQAEAAAAAFEQTELDALRMRQMISARRAAIRGRTYMLLGAMLCGVGCAKLILMIVPLVRREGWGRLVIGYALAASAAVIGLVMLLRQAEAFNRESRAQPMPEPAQPPDFSTLSDGSQHARNLEEMR